MGSFAVFGKCSLVVQGVFSDARMRGWCAEGVGILVRSVDRSVGGCLGGGARRFR